MTESPQQDAAATPASKDSWWIAPNFDRNRTAAQDRMRVERRPPAVDAYLAAVESLDERENCGHATSRTMGRPDSELPPHRRL